MVARAGATERRLAKTAGRAFDELLRGWQEVERPDGSDQARQIRMDLVYRVVPGASEHLASACERLEVLPGFVSAKWQLHRIRAEARQDEARQAGHPVGSVNDYFDFSYKDLARSIRRALYALQRFFPQLSVVADRVLTSEERVMVGELARSLGDLELHKGDDLEFLRHASSLLPRWRLDLQELRRVLERNIGPDRR